ncbi:MAG: HD domain-containing phosphohydrolase [Planctomycetota bacterium]
MPYLKIIQGTEKDMLGKVTLDFSNDAKFIIGRNVTNNLVLSKNIKCSRQHAEIFKKIITSESQIPQEEYFIRDLNSKNGTFLNNNKIQPTPENEGEKLVDGMIITIGDSSFVFATTKIADDIVTEEVKQIKSVSEEEEEEIGNSTVEIELNEEKQKEHPADFIGKKLSSKQLTYIYEIARIIASEKIVQPLLERVLKFTTNITHSNSGYIILLENKTDKISFLATYPKEIAANPQDISKTIVKRVVQYTRPILTSDALLDGRFSQSDSIISGDIRSVICAPLIKMPSYDGVLYLKNNSLENTFNENDLEIASAIAIQTGLAMISISASDKSKRMLIAMAKVLVSTVEMKDLSIQGHSERVTNYASAIARRLGMNHHEISQVQLAALLHDTGKIAATSTAKEEHIYAAERLLSQIPDLGEIILAVKYHHERVDGKGFPYHITNIPLITKIISAANILDNLVSHGGIKGTGLSIKEALSEIQEQSNKEFDPLIVNALISCFNDGSLFKSTQLFEDLLQ